MGAAAWFVPANNLRLDPFISSHEAVRISHRIEIFPTYLSRFGHNHAVSRLKEELLEEPAGSKFVECRSPQSRESDREIAASLGDVYRQDTRHRGHLCHSLQVKYNYITGQYNRSHHLP